jgi:hypothetical protein
MLGAKRGTNRFLQTAAATQRQGCVRSPDLFNHVNGRLYLLRPRPNRVMADHVPHGSDES